MALKRTFENRGKRPVEHGKLKPNGVYAIRHILPQEIAEEWGVNDTEQWGLVMLDSSRDVRRTWNVGTRYKWQTEAIDSTDLELWTATEKEMQFAHESENAEVMTRRYENEKVRCGVLEVRLRRAEEALEYYHRNIFHRIARHFATFFS